MKRAVCCCCLVFALFLLALSLRAQQTPAAGSPASMSSTSSLSRADLSKEVSDKLAQLDQRVTAAQSAGDNAWMLVSAALVLLMTGP
jgi:Amt family ammonium transporter